MVSFFRSDYSFDCIVSLEVTSFDCIVSLEVVTHSFFRNGYIVSLEMVT